MALPDVSLRRPVATAMLYVGIAVLGVVSYARLPIDLLPDVSFPTLSVWTPYTDAAPAEVERWVTEPIERALYSIPGVRDVTSRSQEGQSLVQLQFAWGTDMEFATLHTREQLDNLIETLPQGSDRPVILRSDPTSDPIMTLAVGGSDLRNLRDLSEAVFKRRLEQLDGVSLAGIAGGPERELRVVVDPAQLGVHDVSLEEIKTALDDANYNAPGGTIKRGRFEYSLRTLGQFQAVEQLLDVVIDRPQVGGGSTVRLRDVAVVQDTIAELETIARYNGQTAIGLQIYKEANTNTVRVADRVDETLVQLREEFPGVTIEVASSQAKFIEDAISNVVSALLFGGVLAFLVLFLFLRDPRYPIAIGMAIPISIMAAFALCYAADVSLNIMSLGGLALGVGLLVDNSIVVLENIFRHRETSEDTIAAASIGAREVAAAITASTLTTIAVFGPVLYVEGVAGALFFDLSLAVTFSLVASLLVALTLLPVLAARVGRKREKQQPTEARAETTASPRERPRIVRLVLGIPRAGVWAVTGLFRGIGYVGVSVGLTFRDIGRAVGRMLAVVFGPFLRWFESAFEAFAERYERTLEWALEHRAAVVGIATLALAGAVLLARVLPMGLMPTVDERQFRVEVELPVGTPIETTDQAADRLESLLLDLDGVEGVFARVGRARGTELVARELTGLHNAALDVQLAESGRPTDEVVADFRAGIAASGVDPAYVSVETGRATSLGRALALGSADMAVKVQGGEIDELLPVAEVVAERLSGMSGLADVRLDFQRTQPELLIEIDREVAARHELTVTQVANAIEAYLRGAETDNAYAEFADKVDIRVTIPEERRQALPDVLALRLNGIPIGELVTPTTGFGPVEIRREDQNRTIQVLADVTEGGLAAAVRRVEPVVAGIERPALTTIRVGGENEEMRESFQSLIFAFLLALGLVYLIMAAQFESLVQPLVVLTAVPLAAFGAILALWIAGGGINVMSGIGLVILIGIVVNDAIVKVDFINQRRRAGLSKRRAILEAGRLRLRPIIMTTVTTVVGLLPLALGLGAGADLRAPLAVAVIGGLISATFLTLIVVPVVYSVMVEPRVSVAAAGERGDGPTGPPTAPYGGDRPAGPGPIPTLGPDPAPHAPTMFGGTSKT